MSPRALGRRLAAVVPLGLVLLGSCGWHAGLVAPEGAEDARTIGVEMFGVGDAVLERDLEPLIHDQLSRSVSDLVDLDLVSPRRADLVVRGRILEYGRRGGIRSPDNDPLETAVRVTVEASLVLRSSGAVLASATATIPSGYITAELNQPAFALDEDEYLIGGRENEVAARHRALRFVADELVLDLFAR